MDEISVEEFKKKLESFEAIDVREADEFDEHIPDSVNIPLGRLIRDFGKGTIDLSGGALVYCGSGFRGRLACETLEKIAEMKGLSLGKLFNLQGGFKTWEESQ